VPRGLDDIALSRKFFSPKRCNILRVNQHHASGRASDGVNLLGMEMDAYAFLDSPLNALGDRVPWTDMTIRRSEGAQWLITGRASGKVSDSAQIADDLARIWEEHLRYSYRSAHAVGMDADSVSLRAVTQGSPNGIWVTAYIQVALS
jgi:hypothetical protein